MSLNSENKPAQQKALILPSVGESYTVTTRPIPVPGPDNILVRIEGIGLNPGEWKAQRGVFVLPPECYPLMFGTDGAGTVVQVGANVKRVEVGDRVLFQGWITDPDLSSHQQYAVVLVDFITKLPPQISTLEASSIPLALSTAAFGLCLPMPNIHGRFALMNEPERGGAALKQFWDDDAKDFYLDQPIVVLGGSSSVGQYVIVIAKYMGYSPIITTSSLKHAEYLRSLGATHTFDRNISDSELATEIENILTVQGSGTVQPLRLVYDCVHSPITQVQIDLVSPGGTLLTVNPVPDELASPSENRRATMATGVAHLYREVGKGMYAKLEEFLQKGIIKPLRIEKLPGGLGGIVDGLRRLELGQVSGVKLVVDPRET